MTTHCRRAKVAKTAKALRQPWRAIVFGLSCLAGWTFVVPAHADAIWVPGFGGNFNVETTTYKEAKFNRVVRQEHDFSCGSAAIATLLSYHYRTPRNENAVFEEMIAEGDAKRIREQGFALEDMQRYLARHGFQSGGFRAPLDILVKAGVPAIVLVNTQGYAHFVVVKGVSQNAVLVGDPALGVSSMTRDAFEEIWSGVMFVIIDHDSAGREFFNHADEWQHWQVDPDAPFDVARDMRHDVASFLLMAQGVNQFTRTIGGVNALDLF